ncbi:hypothetical protein M885DRAFT_521212 [Pelagophyceae sp. CCMP2097]|nr:hypothetical protein M885DRAFT_521212 [Pelagophyceae sp. CCMP2097]
MKGFEAALTWLGLFRAAEALSLTPRPFLALLRDAPLTVFSTGGCRHCVRAKRALDAADVAYATVDVGEDASARQQLEEHVGLGFTVPQVFLGERRIGGADDLEAAMQDGSFARLIEGLDLTAYAGLASKRPQTAAAQFDVAALRRPGSPLNVLCADAAALLRGVEAADADADISRGLQRQCLKLLDAHVTDSGVDYDALRTSAQMASFVAATQGLAQLDDAACLKLDDAFWINTYNALVMHAQVVVGMGATPAERTAFFSGETGATYRIGGFDLSLDAMEHGVLRRSPTGDARAFGAGDLRRAKFLRATQRDARIHFALNCGAKSCPPVKLFAAATLDRDLAAAAAAFVSAECKVDGDTVTLSKLFLWYGADFGAGEFAVLGALAKFVPGTPLAAAIFSAAAAPGCKVEYADYDWGRNDA